MTRRTPGSARDTSTPHGRASCSPAGPLAAARRRWAVAVAAALVAAPAAAQPPNEQVFTAVPPCRIVDTRLVSQPLVPGETRAFHAVQGNDLVPQGGKAGGCGIPGYGGSPPVIPRVQALMVNLVAVGPQGPGHLSIWADGPLPLASALNYAAVPGLNLANGLVVPLSQDTTPGADFLVRAAISSTHLVVDVVGYFSRRHPLAGKGVPGAAVWGTGDDPNVFELCTGPTGIKFGLSEMQTTWENAPYACPAGYWVCSEAETQPCDTQREDTFCDQQACDGTCVDMAPSAHRGWLADLEGRTQARFRVELGDREPRARCSQFAVWCCTF